jgi:hypothetical protein
MEIENKVRLEMGIPLLPGAQLEESPAKLKVVKD